MSEAPFSATLALIIWPVVALWLFSTRPRTEALLWTILGGFLLLPVGVAIKFQGVPEFDKTAAASLAALAGCIVSGWRPQIWRRIGIVELLIIFYVVGPLVTAMLNGDPVLAGGLRLPGTGF